MTSLELHRVSTREEFDAVVDVVWEGMHEPYRPEFQYLHPVHGYTEQDRLASIKADADRRWQWAVNDPRSHWLYVTRPGSKEVLGVGEWQIFTENPYPNGPVKVECTWYPEGETRDFVTEYVNQLYYARTNWMNRPFIALGNMAVMPAARGHGVGSLILEWGVRTADELGMECWLEASNMGKDIYEKVGFQTLMTVSTNMHRKNASQTWKRLQNQFPPSTATLMWRPSTSQGPMASFWQVMANHAKQH